MYLKTIVLALAAAAALQASTTIHWHPGPYVYVASDNISDSGAPMDDLSFIAGSNWQGVQKCYFWANLETGFNTYDYTELDADLDKVWSLDTTNRKRLVIQIQYKTFDGSHAVPKYMWNSTNQNYGSPDLSTYGDYQEGSTQNTHLPKYQAMYWLDKTAGLSPQRKINARLQALYQAIGAHIISSGRANELEAVVINESAIGNVTGVDWDPKVVVDTLAENLWVLRNAFPTQPIFDYVNLIKPGTGDLNPQSYYITAVAEFCRQYLPGVGIGGPDVANFNGGSPCPSYTDTNVGTTLYPVVQAYYGKIPIAMSVQKPDQIYPEELNDFSIGATDYLGTYDLALDDKGTGGVGVDFGGLHTHYMAWNYQAAATATNDCPNGSDQGFSFVFGANDTATGTVRYKVAHQGASYRNSAYPPSATLSLTYTSPIATEPPLPF